MLEYLVRGLDDVMYRRQHHVLDLQQPFLHGAASLTCRDGLVKFHLNTAHNTFYKLTYLRPDRTQITQPHR